MKYIAKRGGPSLRFGSGRTWGSGAGLGARPTGVTDLIAGGGPGGEGEGESEVVGAGGGGVLEGVEFVEEALAVVEVWGDFEGIGFEEDAEVGEEVAAGDEEAAEGVAGRVGAAGDGDGEEGRGEGIAFEEFDDGGADAGGVESEGFVGVEIVAGEEGGDAADDFEVGEGEGEGLAWRTMRREMRACWSQA